MNGLLQLFMKAPVPGRVKTRLCPPLSSMQAARVHETLCLRLCEKLSSVPGMTTEIWAGGDVSHPFFTELSQRFGLPVYEQINGDLGEKMHHAIQTGLMRAESVIVVGGDCLSVDATYVQEAGAALERYSDAVIGPALDGGYVLVGAKRCIKGMFDHVAWGTDQALSATLANFLRLNISITALSDRWDIDTVDDLENYAPEILRAVYSK